MVIVCHNCTARLQIAEEKVPAHSFALRCPKCQSVINVEAHANTLNASLSGVNSFAGKSVPPVAPEPVRPPLPAPEPVRPPLPAPTVSSSDVMLQQLLQLLQGPATPAIAPAQSAPAERRILLCIAPSRREAVARLLVAPGHRIGTAADFRQAVERLKDEHIHVVVIDAEFAPDEDGFRSLQKIVQTMRPAQRRRLILVKIAPDARTADQHTAFLESVNLLVNTADLHLLPEALERNMRHHNELYRDFFEALNVAAI